jgi:subtilisin family serine protease
MNRSARQRGRPWSPLARSLGRAIALVLATSLVACGGAPTGGSTSDAPLLALEPRALAFLGTSSHTIDVTANGAWTATSAQPWLTIDPSSGSGNATVTVTVNRMGLTPDHYAGTVLFEGTVSSHQAATIYMRFPTVSGTLSNVAGDLTTDAATLQAQEAPDPFAFPHREGELVVTLDPYVVAVEAVRDAGEGTVPAVAAAVVPPEAMLRSAQALARAYGLERVQAIAEELHAFVMSGPNARGALQRLQRDGRVLDVHPNYLVSMHRVPNDPHYGTQAWHYSMVGLPTAWDLAIGSHEVVAAVIDSAIKVDHPDLDGRIVGGYDFRTNTRAIQTPAHWHGTHVAGTIGAHGNNGIGVSGVAWDVRIMPLNVFGTDGSASLDDVVRAIVFAAGSCATNSAGALVCPDAAPADVINLSLGIPNPDCLAVPRVRVLEDSVSLAIDNGVSVVAAAGNDGCSVMTSPANIAGVLAVGALAASGARAR